jgi:hypothetical protein
MCNLYTYKLSRDEIRGLLQHYRLVGQQWAEVFEREMAGKNDEALSANWRAWVGACRRRAKSPSGRVS